MENSRRGSDIPRVLGKLAICFVVLLALFCVLKIAAAAIPAQPLQHSIEESAVRLHEEGDYKRFFGKEPSFQVDNWTTSIMLTMCATERGSLLEAAFGDYRYYDASIQKNAHTESFYQQAIGNAQQEDQFWIAYARYWNGYLIVLKPLLLFLNLDGIRILFAVLTLALLLADACLLARLRGIVAGALFFLSFLAVNCFIAAISLSLFFTFFIALAGALFVLVVTARKRQVPTTVWWAVPFFVIGALTSYFDLLCTPIITLGIPLALVVYLGADAESGNGRRGLLSLLVVSIVCWGFGYVLLWAPKWIISSIVLGRDVVSDAIGQVFVHMSTVTAGAVATDSPLDAIARNTTLLFPTWATIALAVIGVVLVVAAIALNRRLRPIDWRTIAALVFIAALPYLWYLFTVNHSYVHFWFTYRAQVVTLVGVAFAIESLFHPLVMLPRKKHEDS